MSNSTFDSNSAAYGGGIDGSGTVSNSTFSGNPASYYGGGIHNAGDTLTVSSSTFSANSANSGGGIYNGYLGTLTVSNSTLSGNRASGTDPMGGGGIYTRGGEFGGTTLQNTIVANSPTGYNCVGYIANGGGNLRWNLSFPDTTCPGINGDPKLGPLQDNGGPTQTMALLPGSAALDAADDAICAAPPVNNLDQRGIARPQGPHCDIGAYEAPLPPRAFLPIIMR